MHQPDLETVIFCKTLSSGFCFCQMICNTKSNSDTDWINFEQGFLYAFSDVSRIVLYGQPWIPFQHKQITNEILSSFGFSYRGLLGISRATDLIQYKTYSSQ